MAGPDTRVFAYSIFSGLYCEVACQDCFGDWYGFSPVCESNGEPPAGGALPDPANEPVGRSASTGWTYSGGVAGGIAWALLEGSGIGVCEPHSGHCAIRPAVSSPVRNNRPH